MKYIIFTSNQSHMRFAKLTLSLLLIMSFIALSSYGQNRETIAFNKVKEFYFKKVLGRTTGETSIYFNRNEKAIEIIGYLIPVLEVKIKYTESDRKAKHFVEFICETNGCILPSDDKDNKQSDSFGVPFGSKQDCYDFINVLAELKEALRKM